MLAAESIARSGTVRLPFGAARTSPIDAQDVADVVAEILANPKPHVGKVHELTGPRSEDMTAIAAEYSEAQLHAEHRYDRLTRGVDALLGRPATSVRAYVAKHPELWSARP
jgi:hypothetical protein